MERRTRIVSGLSLWVSNERKKEGRGVRLLRCSVDGVGVDSDTEEEFLN